MIQSDGTIKYFDLNDASQREELELLERRYRQALDAGESASSAPITSDQAKFFATKGNVFRELWGKRLARGLTPHLAVQLKTMIDEFIKGNKNEI